jgi:phosphoglycerate kinase
MSHLGRPDGKVIEKARLLPVSKRLSELLGEPVLGLKDCIGDEVKKQIDNSKERVILLENLRFHAEEEANDAEFAKKLASLGEIFVNDAFGTAHRAHASTEGVTHYLPSVAGFLLGKEIEYLGSAVTNPKQPFMVILGGAKVSDKIGIIANLLKKASDIIIGGGMAYTFLKAEGENIGKSKLETDKIELAKKILEDAENSGVNIHLPVDHVVSDKVDANAEARVVEKIRDTDIALDIGPKTVKNFEDVLKSALTIVWNGPLGLFEIDKFAAGSKAIAEFISKTGAVTIIGGGDTAAAITKFGLASKMTHISTGGGASLEFLEGNKLPGIEALMDKK